LQYQKKVVSLQTLLGGFHDKVNKKYVLMGWDLGADIRPHAYTKDEWFNGPHAMFYYNVEEDKEVLYES
jgi:hypothetical protein